MRDKTFAQGGSVIKSKSLTEPLIRSISDAAEERIYGFTRKTLFSPSLTGNPRIKLCAVNGTGGVSSQRHTHPGDELVITLDGATRNFSGTREYPLRQLHALAMPPQTEHQTVVETQEWNGISVYCDDCPLINGYTPSGTGGITVSPLEPPGKGCIDILHSRDIFLPLRRETELLSLAVYSSRAESPSVWITHQEETVYFVIAGQLQVSWANDCHCLGPKVAALLPAGFKHALKAESPCGCLVVAASCSACPLTKQPPKPPAANPES